MQRGDLLYYGDNLIGFVTSTRQHGWLEVGGISGLTTIQSHEAKPVTSSTLHEVANFDGMAWAYKRSFGFSPALLMPEKEA